MNEELQKMLDELPKKKYAKLSDKQLEGIEILKAHNGGALSAKKQWKQNRAKQLIKSKKGGDKCRDEQKGIFTLSKENLSQQGKNGHQNGLGKLSVEELKQITSNAGKANREKNGKLKVEDVIFMRNNFIPNHPEYGAVAFSKKYNVTDCTVRSAIKRRSFKDID